MGNCFRKAGCILVLAPLLSILGNPGLVHAQSAPQQEVRAAIPVADSSRKLGIGDQVTYQVVEDRDPPVRLVVTDAGELDIPYLGRVKVVGKTVGTIRALIKRSLEDDYYHNATVKLAVDSIAKTAEASKGTVYLSGQVRNPGPQELMPGEESTAGKIILRAGGLAEFADSRKVKIVRKSDGGGTPETLTVDLKEVLERGRIDKDVQINDGDLIIVPQRLINW